MSNLRAWFSHGRGRASLLMLCAGAVLPLAFAPFGWYPLAVPSLAVFILGLNTVSPRHAFARAWWYGIGMFGVGVSWVYVSIHHYGHASIAAAAAIALVLVMFLSLYPALAAYLANRWGPAQGWMRTVLLLPALWVLAEWLRGWVLTGFPWLNVGYSQIDSPLAGFAPLVGVYGVSWVTLIAAGLLVQAWDDRKSLARCGGWLAALLVLVIAGAVLNAAGWTQPDGKRIRVSLLQGNISQDLKWQENQRMATVELYARLSRESKTSRLIIWPETAIPAFYHQVEDSLIPQLDEAAQNWKTDFIIGIPLLERDSWQYYNSVMSLGSSHAFYHKQHLVPFGEYMPLRPLLESFLTALDLAMADFSEGAPDQVLLRGGGQAIGTSICYEVAFGEEVIRALPEAQLLVNVSNDGWFGDSLAPHQHLEIARMRARETERYMLRATNTGISAIIDHKGQVQQQSPQFQVDVLTDKVQPRKGATPYVGWGNYPVVSGAALLVLWLLVLRQAAVRARLSGLWSRRRRA